MDHSQLAALAKEFAKNLKTDADLNEFSKALKKLTVETALNAELTDEKHCFARGTSTASQVPQAIPVMAIARSRF